MQFSYRSLLAASLLLLSGSSAAFAGTRQDLQQIQAQNRTSGAAAKTCSYDPAIGKPNPLGMRAFITAKQDGKNVVVVFEQFPSPVRTSSAQAKPVTIANRRELVFYDTTLAEARSRLLKQKAYYSELVGYPDKEGFGPVNAVLTCR